MKTKLYSRAWFKPGHRQEEGGVLVLTIVLCTVMGIILSGYLVWASQHSTLIKRSQAWNQAIPVAEAGIEEALAHLHDFPDNRGLNYWKLDGGYYTKSRNVGGDAKYIVKIDESVPPVIISEGRVNAPLQSGKTISRTIRVTTKERPLLSFSIATKNSVEMNGNKVLVDSFDSSDPKYSTDGHYDPAKRKDGGNVSCNAGLKDSFDIGNADIYGKVAVGPGGELEVRSNGGVGSTAWHDAGNHGVQSGWFSQDANVDFPVIDESDIPSGSLTPSSGSVGGDAYQYLLSGGTYDVSQLSGGAYVTADSVLIVRDKFDLSDKTPIVLASTNVHLKVYCYAPSGDITGLAVMNPGTGANFQYYGMPSNTSLKFHGLVNFVGIVYAPDADLEMGGGGNSVNFQGACMGKSLNMHGNFNMHFDEALKSVQQAGYIIISWNEI